MRPPRALTCTLLILLAAPGAAAASALEDRIRARIEAAFIADSMQVAGEPAHARVTLQRVYTARDFRPLWVSPDGPTARGRMLAEWLASQPFRHGLRPDDYHLGAVLNLETADRAAALVDLELALSDAFLMLASHFLAGRLNPESLDAEWHAARRHRDLVPVIETAATQSQPGDALAALLPRAAGYASLVRSLAELRAIRGRGGWSAVADGPTLRSGDAGPRVAEVAERLRQSGDFRGDVPEVFGPELAAAVTRFQARHGLDADGAVGPATLRALNVPVQTRIEQIVVNLERWRWLPESLGERYVIVNIAGFRLDVVEDREKTLSMRVVVGLPYRRTPVFSGSITYLVLNPSWEVPRSIAVRDKLPLIKADPDYLPRQGYRLLEGWGADERLVDPATVDWNAVSAANFGFRLRQQPGPLNALGRVKFMFPNPYAVYLHDTPARELFARESRPFSSGCIRVEQPLELAELLLAGAEHWRRADIERAIRAGTERAVRLPQPMPVHLLYWTAWAEEDSMHYRDDIYRRDDRVLRELRDPSPPRHADDQ